MGQGYELRHSAKRRSRRSIVVDVVALHRRHRLLLKAADDLRQQPGVGVLVTALRRLAYS